MTDTLIQTDVEDPEYLGRARQPHVETTGIRVSNKAFAAGLARAVSICGRGINVPIIACVLLRAADGVLTIEATNMEQALRQTIAATGVGHGCVNVVMLDAIFKRLPGDSETTLIFARDSLTWKCGTARGSLEILPVEDFPQLSDGAFECIFTMTGHDLLHILTRTVPFISSEETRYYLGGIHVCQHLRDGIAMLRANATDGHWLGDVLVPLPEGATTLPDIIVPKAAASEIMKMAEAVPSVEISASFSRVRVAASGAIFTSKLIDATYPEIDRVIPRSNPNVLKITKTELARVSGLTSISMDKGFIISVLLLATDGVSISTGEAANKIECEINEGTFTYEGNPLRIGFQNKYLVEAARLFSKDIVLSFSDPNGAMVARDPDDMSTTLVFYPYKV